VDITIEGGQFIGYCVSSVSMEEIGEADSLFVTGGHRGQGGRGGTGPLGPEVDGYLLSQTKIVFSMYDN
jgi:hypothetical protein